MSTRRAPLEGQREFRFMALPRRTRRPKLAIVRADDQPAELEPKPVKTKRRLKAG
jgi:hypothetical protein